MAAQNTDNFMQAPAAWTGAIGSGGVADGVVTTIPLVSAINLPTGTAIEITIDRVNSSGAATPSLREVVRGVVSGNNLISCVRGAEGTAQSHNSGAVVECMLTADMWNRAMNTVVVEHAQDGSHSTVLVTGRSAKATPVDGDTFLFWDSIGNVLANLTWANIKTTLKSWILGDPDFTYSYVQRQAIINGAMEVVQELGTGTVALVNNTAKYICDLFSVTPSGTAVSAGTAGQISNSTLGTTGYSLKVAGVTITGSGTIVHKYRIESADALKYKNKIASFACRVLHDVGSNINYVITIRKANSSDNFGAVTDISNSGNIAVVTGTGTLIKFENVSLGDCSNGIEIEVKAVCGAITTNNFETTEWQMNVGAVALPFVCETRAEELAKVKRYLEYVGVGWTGKALSVTDVYAVGRFEVEKRIAVSPTLTTTTPEIDEINVAARSGTASTIVTNYWTSIISCSLRIGGFAGMTGNNMTDVNTNCLKIDARFTA